jgi:hypothetical protein
MQLTHQQQDCWTTTYITRGANAEQRPKYDHTPFRVSADANILIQAEAGVVGDLTSNLAKSQVLINQIPGASPKVLPPVDVCSNLHYGAETLTGQARNRQKPSDRCTLPCGQAERIAHGLLVSVLTAPLCPPS